ncbi:uncharacterized protein BBA_08649 [Beauveria bassiana ARSEF 2860]|uniref:Uncharacterized protein n=1 Tax=Beauveria bassiana (strain ARSEF 2860) TaxID=655819 RepID=J5J7N7_BEAB2|nr:uncharacterized protein BBA_08649 [Beauveria bassiana ARSEF 2860]EJP62428.1 hypothetical protein BBA_08649 [Beauveria bassiana ARSEF 2860]
MRFSVAQALAPSPPLPPGAQPSREHARAGAGLFVDVAHHTSSGDGQDLALIAWAPVGDDDKKGKGQVRPDECVASKVDGWVGPTAMSRTFFFFFAPTIPFISKTKWLRDLASTFAVSQIPPSGIGLSAEKEGANRPRLKRHTGLFSLSLCV